MFLFFISRQHEHHTMKKSHELFISEFSFSVSIFLLNNPYDTHSFYPADLQILWKKSLEKVIKSNALACWSLYFSTYAFSTSAFVLLCKNYFSSGHMLIWSKIRTLGTVYCPAWINLAKSAKLFTSILLFVVFFQTWTVYQLILYKKRDWII